MSPNRYTEKGYRLPYEVDPERVGYCIPIPEDPNHQRAFLGALYELTWARNWENDGTDKGLLASRVWKEIYFQVEDELGRVTCEGEERRCVEYPNTASFIQYSPNDPRVSPDLVPQGYASPPWYYATPASNLAYGSLDGDIITTFERQPITPLIPTITDPEEIWPTITLNLVGAGTVRVYFRNLLLGGTVIVQRSDNLLLLETFELNKDVPAFPPELNTSVIQEYEFDSPGVHWLKFHVVPGFDVSELPITYGAGIEKVELCGFVTEDTTMDCCDDILQALEQLRLQGASQENWQRKTAYDGQPDSIHIQAPTITFNQQEAAPTGPEQALRDTALCAAVTQYVYNRVAAAMYALAAAAGLALGGGGALVVFGGPLGWVVGGIIAIVGALTMDALEQASENTDALQEIICKLYDALDGVTINQANFTSAINGLTAAPGDQETILSCLQAHPSALENWLYFLDLLGSGYDAAQGGVSVDCDCSDPCAFAYDFETNQNSGPWTVIKGVFRPTGIRGQLESNFELDVQIDMPDGCSPYGICIEANQNSGSQSDQFHVYIRETSGGPWVDTTWAFSVPAYTRDTYCSEPSYSMPATIYGLRIAYSQTSAPRLCEVTIQEEP